MFSSLRDVFDSPSLNIRGDGDVVDSRAVAAGDEFSLEIL